MKLQIGTILIAKEDTFMSNTKVRCLTKGKPYKVKKLTARYFTIESDIDEHHDWEISTLDQHFTIKRYTLTDLQTRTDIMVRIENEEQAKKLQNAGLAFFYKSYYEPYYGFTEGFGFIWLTKSEQQGRILLESIDEIDLGDEGKEEEPKQEAKLYPFYYYAKGNYSCNCAVCKQDFQGDKRATMCLECAIKQHHIEIDFAYSEISRLKGENERLKSDLGIAVSQLEILQLQQSTPDLTKRERMAWELVVHSNIQYEKAFEMVDTFLAKSKEVGNA